MNLKGKFLTCTVEKGQQVDKQC